MSNHKFTRILSNGAWESISALSKAIEEAFPDTYFVVRARGAEVVVEFEEDLGESETETLNEAVTAHQALERGAS